MAKVKIDLTWCKMLYRSVGWTVPVILSAPRDRSLYLTEQCADGEVLLHETSPCGWKEGGVKETGTESGDGIIILVVVNQFELDKHSHLQDMIAQVSSTRHSPVFLLAANWSSKFDNYQTKTHSLTTIYIYKCC